MSASAVHPLCDFWPVFPVLLHCQRELLVLLLCPVVFRELCSQSKFPSLEALLVRTTIDMLRNLLPIAASVLDHCDCELLVLSAGPGALDEVRFEDFVPSLQALLVCAGFNNVSDELPVALVFPDCLEKLLIFLVGPLAFDEVGIQCLEPSLPTLLWGAACHVLCNHLPVPLTVLGNSQNKQLILALVPVTPVCSVFSSPW